MSQIPSWKSANIWKWFLALDFFFRFSIYLSCSLLHFHFCDSYAKLFRLLGTCFLSGHSRCFGIILCVLVYIFFSLVVVDVVSFPFSGCVLLDTYFDFANKLTFCDIIESEYLYLVPIFIRNSKSFRWFQPKMNWMNEWNKMKSWTNGIFLYTSHF